MSRLIDEALETIKGLENAGVINNNSRDRLSFEAQSLPLNIVLNTLNERIHSYGKGRAVKTTRTKIQQLEKKLDMNSMDVFLATEETSTPEGIETFIVGIFSTFALAKASLIDFVNAFPENLKSHNLCSTEFVIRRIHMDKINFSATSDNETILDTFRGESLIGNE